MRFPRFIFILCALYFGLSLRVFALDREAFTFTDYSLEVRVEPAQQRLSGRGKLILRNDSAVPQKNLVLQISSTLDWRSIQLNGKPVQFVSQPYTSDIDHTGSLSEAIVTLPQEIAPRATLELEIGYDGLIPPDVTRLTRIGVAEEAAKHSDWDQVGKSFTALRGVGYVAWYPIATESASLSEGSDVFKTLGRWKQREKSAQMKVKLCQTNDGATSVTLGNGEKSEKSSAPADGCESYIFSSLGTTAPAFAVGPYQSLDRGPLSVSYLPAHASGADSYGLAFDLTSPFVTDWFGGLHGSVRVVDLADVEAAPFESGSVVFTPLAHEDSRLAQLTMVHQLTHAALQSPRPWIYEGLAHFAQAAYRESQSGRQAALDFMGLHRTVLAEAEKAVAGQKNANDPAGESLINTSTEEFYRSKAMYVWWMLRDMVGETALKKALGNYHPDQDKEPSYLQRLVEAQSKRDLESFFDEWVYRDRGLPDFKIDSAVQRQTLGAGSVVTITVVNLGDAGAEVPITLHMEGGDSTKRLQVNAKSRASIRMEAVSQLREIVVNDGSVPESDMSNNVFKIDAAAPVDDSQRLR